MEAPTHTGKSEMMRSGQPSAFDYDVANNRLRFLPGGKDRFDTLRAMIKEAREELCLHFYIFEEDDSGTEVRDLLIDAASGGVKVRLMVDGFGANASDRFFEPLVRAGAKFARFGARWSRNYLIRNHQKLVIADQRVALVGGFNIADGYFRRPGDGGWCDLGARIEGPIVADLVTWFDQLEAWVTDPRAQWFAMLKLVRNWQPGNGKVQLLIGGPAARFSSWTRRVRSDLDHASRLDMMMAYFSPAGGVLRRIAKIARRGSAALLLAGKSDNQTTISATRSLYHYLLANAVRLWEFTEAKLHTKLIVVDDATYIGSANFDMRSLYINLELMLRIEDRGLAQKMREFIGIYRGSSLAITPQLHASRASLLNRIRWNIAWFLVSAIDYTVSRRLNIEG